MRYKASELENKRMSPEVYKLRRKVINLIYEAKRLAAEEGVELPRLTVRVTDNHPCILGVARMAENVIFITEKSTASRGVVFHEILHAAFGQQHVRNCPLMNPTARFLTDGFANKLFKMYVRNAAMRKKYGLGGAK